MERLMLTMMGLSITPAGRRLLGQQQHRLCGGQAHNGRVAV